MNKLVPCLLLLSRHRRQRAAVAREDAGRAQSGARPGAHALRRRTRVLEPDESDRRRARARLGARGRELPEPVAESSPTSGRRATGSSFSRTRTTTASPTRSRSSIRARTSACRSGSPSSATRCYVSQSPDLIVYTKDARRQHHEEGSPADRFRRPRPRPRPARRRVRTGRQATTSTRATRATTSPTSPASASCRRDLGRERRAARRLLPGRSSLRMNPDGTTWKCSRRTSAIRTKSPSIRSATSSRPTTTTTATR